MDGVLNNWQHRTLLLMVVVATVVSCGPSKKGVPLLDDLSLNGSLQTVSKDNIFKSEGHFNWCRPS